MPSDAKIVVPVICLGLLPTAIAHTLYFSSLSNLKSLRPPPWLYLNLLVQQF
jgi:drug/metabolite transporter (DMT)-like permease